MLANVQERLDEHDLKMIVSEQAIDHFERTGDYLGLAYSHYSLGFYHESKSDWQLAFSD